jgi:hypothetical protein
MTVVKIALIILASLVVLGAAEAPQKNFDRGRFFRLLSLKHEVCSFLSPHPCTESQRRRSPGYED